MLLLLLLLLQLLPPPPMPQVRIRTAHAAHARSNRKQKENSRLTPCCVSLCVVCVLCIWRSMACMLCDSPAVLPAAVAAAAAPPRASKVKRCISCKKDTAMCKQGWRHRGNDRICTPCYNSECREHAKATAAAAAAAVSAPASPSVRSAASKKRRATDPGDDTTDTCASIACAHRPTRVPPSLLSIPSPPSAVLLAPPSPLAPLELSRLDPSAVMKTHSLCLIRASVDSRRCVQLVLQLVRLLAETESSLEIAQPGVLHNGTRQYTLAQLCEYELTRAVATELRELWPLVARAASTAAGLPWRRYLVSVKIMVAQPGQPAQEIHWDGVLGANGDKKYSVLLYCTDTQSTAVPVFTNEHSLSTPHLPAVKRRKLFSLLEKPKNYCTTPVVAGELLVMKQSVPHYAPEHPSAATAERVVLFDMLSASKDVEQDEYQHFAAGYRREARAQRRR